MHFWDQKPLGTLGNAVPVLGNAVPTLGNLKNLKFFIFWFFDLFERFYINTYDPDLYIARRSGHRSRSTHFILPLKVEPVLIDFPLGHPPSEFTQIGKFNHDRMNERDQKDSKQDRRGPKASQFGADRRQRCKSSTK